MRKLALLITVVLAGSVALYFTSCKKETIYSCNKGINEYVKENKEQFQNISRDQLAKRGIDTQFAIINCLSPENNVRILKEKLTTLLNDNLVSKVDKNHLQELYNYISPKLYEVRKPMEDHFLSEWKRYAENQLGWDKTKMTIYAGTWLTRGEIEALKMPSSVKSRPSTNESSISGGDGNCNCAGGYTCETILGKKCIENHCDKTNTHCGFLWLEECWGTCSL